MSCSVSTSQLYIPYIEPEYVALVPVMTSNTTPSGEAFAHGAFSGYSAYHAFDGVYLHDHADYNAWGAPLASDMYLGYKFTESVVVKSLDISNSDGNTAFKSRCIKDFILQGSNGSAWINIQSFTNINEGTNTFNVYNSNPYLWYRLKILNNYGATDDVDVAELQFYGYTLS